MTLNKLFSFAICWCLFAVFACSDEVAKEQTKALPPIFPDYTGVTVPRTIAPLDFGIQDATHIQTTFTADNGETLETEGDDHIELDVDTWHEFLKNASNISVNVSVWNEQHPDGISYAPFSIMVSNDSIDPWMMYRLIPPGYEGWNKMGIYQRELSSFKEETITDNTDNGKGCMNCHSACNGNPDNFTFHSRCDNGGTFIQQNGELTKINLKNMGPGLQGAYNYWHPSAKYIAFSSNITRQSFMSRSRDKIEGYDLKGEIIIYDVAHKEVLTDERFTDSLTLESFPTFSPDGKWLYFVSAKNVNMPTDYAHLKYSILRVPFNVDNGQLGAVDTVFSAARRGCSAIIPRISPDGRYLMYSTSPSGALFLYHNDSDLGMIDLATGEDIDCSALNSNQSESYHSWSRNGKWVMFSSKRVDGRFTRPFFTHWDAQHKKWTKPFMLPQKSPWDNLMRMQAYNVPDFIVKPVNIDRKKIRELSEDE